MSNTQAIKALMAIASAIVETVEELGEQGLPAGHLYATLMGIGCSLEQFNTIVGTLVEAGKIRKQGHLLLPA